MILDSSLASSKKKIPSYENEAKRFSTEAIQDRLERFKTKNKKVTMSREALIEFVA